MDNQRVPCHPSILLLQKQKNPMIICKCEKDGRQMDQPNKKEKECWLLQFFYTITVFNQIRFPKFQE